MYELPTTVEVFDRIYNVRKQGDFRLILDVITACSDVDLTPQEQAVTALLLFYDGLETIDDVFNEFDTQELIEEAKNKMQLFISCNDENIGYKVNHKLIDWQSDEKLIVAAINPMLGQGQDIRMTPYMHWWTFISYYMGIKESALSTVVDIRNKIVKGKKLEKYEREFKRDNPEYFKWQQVQMTEEQKELVNEIKDIWGNTL